MQGCRRKWIGWACVNVPDAVGQGGSPERSPRRGAYRCSWTRRLFSSTTTGTAATHCGRSSTSGAAVGGQAGVTVCCLQASKPNVCRCRLRALPGRGCGDLVP